MCYLPRTAEKKPIRRETGVPNDKETQNMHLERVGAFIVAIGIAFGLTGSLAASPEGKMIQISVTEKGFEPSALTVKKGEPITLVVTRKTDKTCAKEIVIDEEGIDAKLPLNEAVKVTFTPKKSGEIKYTCGMKMFGGVLKVE